jgi:hypothetical protein
VRGDTVERVSMAAASSTTNFTRHLTAGKQYEKVDSHMKEVQSRAASGSLLRLGSTHKAEATFANSAEAFLDWT